MRRLLTILALVATAFLGGCKENPHIAVRFEGATPLNSWMNADDEQDADRKKKIFDAKAPDRVKILDTRRVYLACSGCGRSALSKPPLNVAMDWKYCRSETCPAKEKLYERVPVFKCPYCRGTGVCPTCRTWGMHEGPMKGRCYNCEEIVNLAGEKKSYVKGHTKDWRVPTVCRNCDGTNLCPVCAGTARCDFCGGDGELTEDEIRAKVDAQEGRSAEGETPEGSGETE